MASTLREKYLHSLFQPVLFQMGVTCSHCQEGMWIQHKPSLAAACSRIPMPPRARCLHQSWQGTAAPLLCPCHQQGGWGCIRSWEGTQLTPASPKGCSYHTKCWPAIKTAGEDNNIWKNKSSSAVQRKKTSCLFSLFEKCINHEMDDEIELFYFLQYLTFSYHKPDFSPFKYYLTFHQINTAFRFDVVKYCIELQQSLSNSK